MQYIKSNPGVQKLDLLDNGITENGCFLLYDSITADTPLQNLKLDHNLFGTRVHI